MSFADRQSGPARFELQSAVVHLGQSPHSGHYVTIVRLDQTWLLFDDQRVEV